MNCAPPGRPNSARGCGSPGRTNSAPGSGPPPGLMIRAPGGAPVFGPRGATNGLGGGGPPPGCCCGGGRPPPRWSSSCWAVAEPGRASAMIAVRTAANIVAKIAPAPDAPNLAGKIVILRGRIVSLAQGIKSPQRPKLAKLAFPPAAADIEHGRLAVDEPLANRVRSGRKQP